MRRFQDDVPPIFAQRVPFSEAFPEIQKASIRVEAEGRGTGYQPKSWTLHAPRISECIDCPNPLCYGGGLWIGHVLHEMYSHRETQRSGGAACEGYEGSPKGRRRYRDCLTTFLYDITIVYK